MNDDALPSRLAELVASTRGFMPDDEGLALHSAALRHLEPGGVAVEIGTYCAKSTVLLGHAAMVRGARVVSIDHHRGSEEQQPGWEYHDASLVDAELGVMDTLPFARRTIAAAGLENVVSLVVGRSADVASWWGPAVDLVFVEVGNTADAARADLAGWGPHVRVGGALVIHDVFPDPADGGRPPYEIYRAALDSGSFTETAAAGSLRVLTRHR